jgi:hypothetical protein
MVPKVILSGVRQSESWVALVLRPKLVLEYVKKYLNEMKRLVSELPEKYRILLPDHLVSNQEIEIYVTKETGFAIDYVGLNAKQKITLHGSDRCFDDLTFPLTEYTVSCNQGSLERARVLLCLRG